MNLDQDTCVPCEGGVPTLTMKEIEEYQKKLVGGSWQLVGVQNRSGAGAKLQKRVTLKDFKSALVFVNLVGEIAEKEGHHPDISLGWGYVELTIWTHKIGGLSRNDFVLAAKIDRLGR